MTNFTNLRLFRKRFIPDEIVELKDDHIISFENNVLITKWHVLKPRKDIDHGASAYFIDLGIKISKEFDANNNLVYWYCDIIDTSVTDEGKTYIFTDLLADVLVMPDKSVRVLDLDEVADFLEDENRTSRIELMSKSLRITNNLLNIIATGHFMEYAGCLEDLEF